MAAAAAAASTAAAPDATPGRSTVSREDRKLMLKDLLDQTFPSKRSAYEILNEIGAGASSIVYKVQCKELLWRCHACRRISLPVPDEKAAAAVASWCCQRVPVHRLCGKVLDGVELAVKEVNMDLISAPIEEVNREIMLLRTLRHDNIIEYYTSFSHTVEDDKGNQMLLIWLVMQLMEHGSVLDVTKHRLKNMRGERPPVEDVFISTILRGVLRALKYLHERQLIHRDMKAGNILLGAAGDVRVADFGVSGWLPGNLFEVPTEEDAQEVRAPLIRRMIGMQKKAKAEAKAQKKMTFVGTPNWMAPEVLLMKDGYDCQADIWSLGITAIELGIGEVPYAEMDPLKVMVRTLDHPPPTLESLSKERQSRIGNVVSTDKNLRDFISKCLHKDPAKRWTVGQLLKHDFVKKSDRTKQFNVELAKWKTEHPDGGASDERAPEEWDMAKDFMQRELSKVPDVTLMNKPATSAIPNRIRQSDRQIVSAWVYTETMETKKAREDTIYETADNPLPHGDGADGGAAPVHPDPLATKADEGVPAVAGGAAPPAPHVPHAPPAPAPPAPTADAAGSGGAAAPLLAPETVKMALRIEDPNVKLKVVDISFEFTPKDTANGIAEELVAGKFITIVDAGQVALFLKKILQDPKCESVTFPLHAVKSELPEGDDGTAHQEKLRAGFAQLIRKPVEKPPAAPDRGHFLDSGIGT